MTRTAKKERMFALVKSFLSGNQTQRDFCLEHDISCSAFQYWLRRCRQEYGTTAGREHRLVSGGFVPLKIASHDNIKTNRFDVVIEYPGGIRISFGSVPEIDLIRDLLSLQVR